VQLNLEGQPKTKKDFPSRVDLKLLWETLPKSGQIARHLKKTAFPRKSSEKELFLVKMWSV
jgi:hypothetical protein